MQKYRKVSRETHSLASSEASQGKAYSKVNHTLIDKANGSTSLEVPRPLLKLTCLAMTSLKRPARPVLWLTANTIAEINLAIKLLSRLNKHELTAFAVGRPLLQVIKTRVLWFTLTLSILSLQGVHD